MKYKEFKSELKQPYAWPGGYPKYFVTSDGDCLCYECATKDKHLIKDAMKNSLNDGWQVTGVDVNWESDLYCGHCSSEIERAYEKEESEFTKEEFDQIFIECVLPYIIEEEITWIRNNPTSRNFIDGPGRREAYNNLVDEYNRDGRITDDDANNWCLPDYLDV